MSSFTHNSLKTFAFLVSRQDSSSGQSHILSLYVADDVEALWQSGDGAAVPTSRVQVFTFSQLEVCSLWSTQPAVLCHTRTVFIRRLKHSPDLSLNIKVKLKDHSSDMEEIWCPSQPRGDKHLYIFYHLFWLMQFSPAWSSTLCSDTRRCCCLFPYPKTATLMIKWISLCSHDYVRWLQIGTECVCIITFTIFSLLVQQGFMLNRKKRTRMLFFFPLNNLYFIFFPQSKLKIWDKKL